MINSRLSFKVIEKKLPNLYYPCTPLIDQDRISPYAINTIFSRKVMRIMRLISIKG